jgi:glycosyltransferase involved in cell wall biosynthesis/capsular polysaccharide biosynthesis protein
MTDAAAGLSVLHVIVRAGPTNSQYNEHCLPVLDTRTVTVCSLFPADVTPPDQLRLFEGDGSVAGCFRALRRALTTDEYDVVHVHAPASGMVTLWTYARLRRPRRDLVFTIHNSWQSFRRRNRMFLRLIMLLFPLVVVCGQAAYESMPKRLRRLRHDKLRVVPNGVDVDRVDRALDGYRPHRGAGFHVAAVSRLIPIKHPHTVLSAFLAMRKRDDTLTFIGDGQLRLQLNDRIQHEKLLHTVSMRGIIARDDVYRELADADAFITTSAGEGLPVAMLEAMACGRPVVASDIPPHREIARAAKGLPLVRVGDTEGYARALERLRAVGPVERAAIGQRLRETVVSHFSVTSMNDAYGRLYRQQVPRGAEVGRTLRTASRLDPETAGLGERLRRRLGFVLALTILGGIVGFGIAFVQAPVFKGETSLQVGRDLAVAADEDTLNTSSSLATRYADLTRREPVLGPVAEDGWAESWRDLQPDVFARVGDKNPQLVEISVYSDSREKAADLVTAVAQSLMRASREAITSSDRAFIGEQLTALESDIARSNRELLRLEDELAVADAATRPTIAARIADLQGTLVELRSSYAELDTLDTSEAGELAVVDEAWTTRSPLRPTPLVLGLAGLAIGLTLAIGWIHLFDRRPPRTPTTAPVPAPDLPEQTHQQRRQHGRARPSAWAANDPSWPDHDIERR